MTNNVVIGSGRRRFRAVNGRDPSDDFSNDQRAVAATKGADPSTAVDGHPGVEEESKGL